MTSPPRKAPDREQFGASGRTKFGYHKHRFGIIQSTVEAALRRKPSAQTLALGLNRDPLSQERPGIEDESFACARSRQNSTLSPLAVGNSGMLVFVFTPQQISSIGTFESGDSRRNRLFSHWRAKATNFWSKNTMLRSTASRSPATVGILCDNSL